MGSNEWQDCQENFQQDLFLSGFRDGVGCGMGITLGGDCVVTSYGFV